MAYYTFFDFVNEQGENVIQKWIRGLDGSVRKKVKVRFNARLDYMGANLTWDPEKAKALEGDCAGLFEIRFLVGRVQYRPLACYGPNRGQVWLLMGVREKSDRFDPPYPCPTALSRMALVLSDRRYLCPHDYR